MSNYLRPHVLQNTRLPCPSPSLGAYSNSCPLSWWCHPTISSSVVPFSSRLLSLPASASFLMSQLFTSGGQCIGASASTSVLQMNTQDWFPIGLTCLISLLYLKQGTLKGLETLKRDSQESSPTPQFKSINSSVLSLLYGPALRSIHDYWKNHSFQVEVGTCFKQGNKA